MSSALGSGLGVGEAGGATARVMTVLLGAGPGRAAARGERVVRARRRVVGRCILGDLGRGGVTEGFWWLEDVVG